MPCRGQTPTIKRRENGDLRHARAWTSSCAGTSASMLTINAASSSGDSRNAALTPARSTSNSTTANAMSGIVSPNPTSAVSARCVPATASNRQGPHQMLRSSEWGR
jgi:hypothetical protein